MPAIVQIQNTCSWSVYIPIAWCVFCNNCSEFGTTLQWNLYRNAHPRENEKGQSTDFTPLVSGFLGAFSDLFPFLLKIFHNASLFTLYFSDMHSDYVDSVFCLTELLMYV